MKLYMMRVYGYKGADPTDKFLFHAENRADATSKMKAWARYHAFTPFEDVDMRESTPNEQLKTSWVHDEYLA